MDTVCLTRYTACLQAKAGTGGSRELWLHATIQGLQQGTHVYVHPHPHVQQEVQKAAGFENTVRS